MIFSDVYQDICKQDKQVKKKSNFNMLTKDKL